MQTALRPVVRAGIYYKFGFVATRYQYCCCPECGSVLNAGPDYQPGHCEGCGRGMDFSGVEWTGEEKLGYLGQDMGGEA